MKKLYYLILIAFALISCDKEISKCGVEDPVEELEWLQGRVNSYEGNGCICGANYYQAIYDNQEVFYSQPNSIYCDFIPEINLYNCEGELIKTINLTDDPDDERPGSPTLIYSCTPSD